MKRLTTLLLSLITTTSILAQSGTIKGKVTKCLGQRAYFGSAQYK